MGGLPVGTSIPATASVSVASPATRDGRTLLQAVPGPARSPEGAGDPSSGSSRPTGPGLTTAQTDKLIGEVFARHSQSSEAVDAFDDLSHGLLLAREKHQEVPCLGPGAEAWTSEDPIDQELAADLCLLCPVFSLCQRYADAAEPEAGTWAGVTREPSTQERRRRVIAEAHERSRRGMTRRQPRAKSARVAPPVRTDSSLDCTCGCGGTTRGGYYLAGHDSRHLAALRADVRSRTLTVQGALAEVAHSERLQAKLRAQLGARG